MPSKRILLLCIAFFITLLSSDQNKDYLKMIRREPYTQMKNYIICQTCKISMKQINRWARSLREHLKGEEMFEEHYRNLTRYACEPYHDHGEWITKYDIIQSKRKMKLKSMDVYGRCDRECETIALACADVLAQYEEEIPEYLYKKMSTAKLGKKVCRDACKKEKRMGKIPAEFENEWGSMEFQEIADDQRQMFRSFVGGELYKREQPKNPQDEQQDYLQRYAEAYVQQQEDEKNHKKGLRKLENKKRARQGLPPLPEEDEAEEGEGDGDGGNDKTDNNDANINIETIKTDL